MTFIDSQPLGSATQLSAEAEAAIADVIGTRIVISYRELDQCFRIARGVGVGLHTIRAWEVEGMPHHHHPGDRFFFYTWAEVWAWYCLRGQARKQPISPSPITSQSWLRST